MRQPEYQDKIIKLFTRSHLLSIREVYARLTPAADYSTVYRNISRLIAAGVLRQVIIGKNDIQYELTAHRPGHEHFICLDCGEVSAVARPRNLSRLAGQSKRVVELVLRGHCGCRSK
ncbi:MAG: transcriptional repressor [Candidatus Paceibacterota bacterium]